MQLSKRPAIYALPSYSLTGDLLSFVRCGLQYRYTRIGQLPSARPVQMWFGQFIHGVLEEAYREYNEAKRDQRVDSPPWREERIDAICGLINARLAARGLSARNERIETVGRNRAIVAINELGPILFPLIHRAEVRLTGARALPVDNIEPQYQFRRADRYEMVGVIDVITHVELDDPELRRNRLVETILEEIPEDHPDRFEVIIDYKGMRRPSLAGAVNDQPSLWNIYGWQTQTYAHLREMQQDSLPVMAGVIIYLNELLPGRDDIAELREEVARGTTDVVPEHGSEGERLLIEWDESDDVPLLPIDFRLKRSIRIISVDQQTILQSLQAFDDVVVRIETCLGRELREGRVTTTWETNTSTPDTCSACDARTWCPAYATESAPSLPAIRPRRSGSSAQTG